MEEVRFLVRGFSIILISYIIVMTTIFFVGGWIKL